MFIINHTKWFLSIGAVLAVCAVVCVGMFGLQPGIDFTGGTIVEVSYQGDVPAIEDVRSAVADVVDSASVRQTGDRGYTVRTAFLSDAEREDLIAGLTFNPETPPTQERVSSIGPVIGEELTSKALWAIGIVIVVIILFIAFSFRKVQVRDEKDETVHGLSSWYYGLAAIIALMFDTLMPTAMFALLGVYAGAEVDILFVTALLAILGYSVNDTIVVFDRIRENVIANHEEKSGKSFDDIVGNSLSQVMTRSINTSLTTFFVLLILYLFGGSTTQFFALTLLAGVVAGTYSSIFLASPLLVVFNQWKGE